MSCRLTEAGFHFSHIEYKTCTVSSLLIMPWDIYTARWTHDVFNDRAVKYLDLLCTPSPTGPCVFPFFKKLL